MRKPLMEEKNKNVISRFFYYGRRTAVKFLATDNSVIILRTKKKEPFVLVFSCFYYGSFISFPWEVFRFPEYLRNPN